jgi:hypothetical protein
VLSLGTKSLFGLGLVAFAVSLVYGVDTSEGAGTTILAFIAAGAFALGAAVMTVGPDRAPRVNPDSPLTHNPAMGGRPQFPAPWPLIGAVAVGFLGVGAATSAVVVVAGIVVAVAAFLGWTFQAWSEHPIFTARFGARLSDRLLVPIGLPVGVFVLIAIIALSISRVLLAVPVTGSRVVAIVVAVLVMASAFFIVSQERMARAALALLSVFALVAVVAAGVAGLAYGNRKEEHKAAVGAKSVTTSTTAPSTVTTVAGGASTPTTAQVSAGYGTTSGTP